MPRGYSIDPATGRGYSSPDEIPFFCCEGRAAVSNRQSVDGYTVFFKGERVAPGRSLDEFYTDACCGNFRDVKLDPNFKVPGVPEDAVALSEAETTEILTRWYGAWKFVSGQPFSRGQPYTDVFVMCLLRPIEPFSSKVPAPRSHDLASALSAGATRSLSPRTATSQTKWSATLAHQA